VQYLFYSDTNEIDIIGLANNPVVFITMHRYTSLERHINLVGLQHGTSNHISTALSWLLVHHHNTDCITSMISAK